MKKIILFIVLIQFVVVCCKSENQDMQIEEGNSEILKLKEIISQNEKELRRFESKVEDFNKQITLLQSSQPTDSIMFFVTNAKNIINRNSLSGSPFVILHSELIKPIPELYLKNYPNFRFEPYYLCIGGNVSGLYYPKVDSHGKITFTSFLLSDSLNFGVIGKDSYSNAIITNDPREMTFKRSRFYPSEKEINKAVEIANKNILNEYSTPLKFKVDDASEIDKVKLSDTSSTFLVSSFSKFVNKKDKFDHYHTFFICDMNDNYSEVFVRSDTSLNRSNFSFVISYHFIDMYDIDKDGINEILISESGYEKEWYSILKYKDNKWQKIYSYISYDG